MKLNTVRPNIESSGALGEQFFSIKDQGMIFDILRSKMYSNPILAICREISCNARDAHREVGKSDVPITIVLPNQLDYSYRIKDSGPGISPDRMSNIFIQYTASTKRDDNLQTGGFGLGCKTPFSYSDTFTVVTVHNGTKYQYTCFIDETKVGKLILHSQEPTKEANGTEIVIPVESKDVSLFVQWTEQSCRHWDVKPIIKGGTIKWSQQEITVKGNSWAITSTNAYDNSHIKTIVDGIEYPLSIDALRTYTDRLDMIDSMHGTLLLYFGVGELSLSASREQVYLDEKTQKKIDTRLQDVFKEIKKLVDDKINAFPDLWQANLYYHKQLGTTFSNLHFLGTLQWNDISLQKGGTSLGCPIFSFAKGKYVRKSGFDPNLINRTRLSYLHFQEECELYINDLPIKEPTPRHVKKAFEDNPNLKQIQIISPTEKFPETWLNTTYHIDKMNPKRLSSIVKVSKRAYTAAFSRLLVFKLDPVSHTYRQISYASIDEDTNKKVICLLQKENYPANSRLPILKNRKTFDLKTMTTIARQDPKVSFYGVDQDTPQKRLDEEFDDFTKLDDYIDQKIVNNKSMDFVEIKFASANQYRVDERVLKNSKVLEKSIANKNSPFLKRIRLYQKLKDINANDTSLLSIYESINGEIKEPQLKKFLTNNPDYNLELLDKECDVKYPLLTNVSTYNFHSVLDHAAHYINLIDTYG